MSEDPVHELIGRSEVEIRMRAAYLTSAQLVELRQRDGRPMVISLVGREEDRRRGLLGPETAVEVEGDPEDAPGQFPRTIREAVAARRALREAGPSEDNPFVPKALTTWLLERGVRSLLAEQQIAGMVYSAEHKRADRFIRACRHAHLLALAMRWGREISLGEERMERIATRLRGLGGDPVAATYPELGQPR